MKIVHICLFVVAIVFTPSISGNEFGASGVEIVSFSGDSFQLNVNELKRILGADEIKDRQVVAVSITGAYRKGKSFLLNIFLKFLYVQVRNKFPMFSNKKNV